MAFTVAFTTVEPFTAIVAGVAVALAVVETTPGVDDPPPPAQLVMNLYTSSEPRPVAKS